MNIFANTKFTFMTKKTKTIIFMVLSNFISIFLILYLLDYPALVPAFFGSLAGTTAYIIIQRKKKSI